MFHFSYTSCSSCSHVELVCCTFAMFYILTIIFYGTVRSIRTTALSPVLLELSSHEDNVTAIVYMPLSREMIIFHVLGKT